MRLESFCKEYKRAASLVHGPKRRGAFPAFLAWLNARVDALTLEDGEAYWSYRHMRDSGRHFRVWSLDKNRVASTDSGVFALSTEGDSDAMPYSGILEEILEVDFGSFVDVLLGCKWYKAILRGRNKTVCNDECGFVRVNTSQTKPQRRETSDVWVYPHQVDQCFYVPIPSMRP